MECVNDSDILPFVEDALTSPSHTRANEWQPGFENNGCAQQSAFSNCDIRFDKEAGTSHACVHCRSSTSVRTRHLPKRSSMHLPADAGSRQTATCDISFLHSNINLKKPTEVGDARIAVFVRASRASRSSHLRPFLCGCALFLSLVVRKRHRNGWRKVLLPRRGFSLSFFSPSRPSL